MHFDSRLLLLAALLAIGPSATSAAQGGGFPSHSAAPTEGAATCGNGVVEAGEDCDGGDTFDLDGCNRDCGYEQVQVLSSFSLQGSTGPGFCTPGTNQLGGAFSGVGLSVLNSTLQDAIDADSLLILLDFLNLDDALGQNDASLEVGLLGGTTDPSDPSPSGLDAWYLAAAGLLDSDDQPTEQLGAAISSLMLSAGPADISLPFVGGELLVRDSRVGAQVGGASSLPAPPPSEFAAGFAAFETLDAATASSGLCGNVTVGTLAQIPVPDEVTTGASACEVCTGSRAYVSCGGGPVTDSCHSLLDILVGGCKVAGCFVTVSDPTQPDVGVGANSPNVLVFEPSGGGIEKVTVVEPLDAYSSWFQFTSGRVHLTNNLDLLFRDGFESGDTAGWSTTVSP